MNDPKYLADYRRLLKDIGLEDFKESFFVPTLVGRGVMGEIGQKPFNRKTAILNVDELAEMRPIDNLLDRVWLIQRGDYGKSSEISVGRAMDNDVIIPEYSISSKHCVFTYESASIAIEDVRSLNGTMIEGERIAPREKVALANGNRITLGRYQFSFFTPSGFIAVLEEE